MCMNESVRAYARTCEFVEIARVTSRREGRAKSHERGDRRTHATPIGRQKRIEVELHPLTPHLQTIRHFGTKSTESQSRNTAVFPRRRKNARSSSYINTCITVLNSRSTEVVKGSKVAAHVWVTSPTTRPCGRCRPKGHRRRGTGGGECKNEARERVQHRSTKVAKPRKSSDDRTKGIALPDVAANLVAATGGRWQERAQAGTSPIRTRIVRAEVGRHSSPWRMTEADGASGVDVESGPLGTQPDRGMARCVTQQQRDK